MFETLSERLGAILDKLTRKGALTEADVGEAMREVRRALLEADVALDVVRDFTDQREASRPSARRWCARSRPARWSSRSSMTSSCACSAPTPSPSISHAAPPVVMMLVGLQGSGKTTTTAKIAKRLQARDKKKVLDGLARHAPARPRKSSSACWASRPASPRCRSSPARSPKAITKRSLDAARRGGYDVLLLDTAGRTHIDEELMDEMTGVSSRSSAPHETLLVADALTGQDAVNLAKNFDARVSLTGIVLTRVDGDGRGGAALSMRAVTGKPIKLIGTGEKLDALEDDPVAHCGSHLGMGDVVGLVEKALETCRDRQSAKPLPARFKKGAFDLDDLAEQLKQMQKLGGMGGVLSMLPGLAKVKKQLDAANLDDKILKRQQAMIGSMTKAERKSTEALECLTQEARGGRLRDGAFRTSTGWSRCTGRWPT